jgi:2-polyprenyl-3-methyl-5-hydroxy-6-metoxy-1,4-benzoquinol methylase
MDLKEYEVIGSELERHWYYIAKGRAMRAMLGRVRVGEVLDVGAGSGVFSRQLLDAGVCQGALCIDKGYREDRTEMHNARPIRFARELDEPPPSLVLFMDVLEHVDDDVGLLRQYTEPMPAGGRILVSGRNDGLDQRVNLLFVSVH